MTTLAGLIAACVLVTCLLPWFEGDVTPTRRERSAVAASVAFAVLVIFEGWLMTAAVAIILGCFIAIGVAVDHVVRIRSQR